MWDNLIFNGLPITIFDDFKYLGSYIGLTNKDKEARKSLIWSAFAKLKPILTSPKPTVKFKTCLSEAPCTSILLTDVKHRSSHKQWLQNWQVCKKMLPKLRPTWWTRIYITWQMTAWYQRQFVSASSVSLDIVSALQKDKPANIYVLYQSKIKQSLCMETQYRDTWALTKQ